MSHSGCGILHFSIICRLPIGSSCCGWLDRPSDTLDDIRDSTPGWRITHGGTTGPFIQVAHLWFISHILPFSKLRLNTPTLVTLELISTLHLNYLCNLNSLRPSDTMWRHKFGSKLAPIMTAPSHYLNNCWLITNKLQWHPSENNFTRDTSVISQWS